MVMGFDDSPARNHLAQHGGRYQFAAAHGLGTACRFPFAQPCPPPPAVERNAKRQPGNQRTEAASATGPP